MIPRDEYGMIPAACRRAIIEWVINAELPGHFLQAILSNDLVEAAGRADHENVQILHVYASLLYNCLPKPSWGSHEAMMKWIDDDGNGRRGWSEAPESWREEVDAVVRFRTSGVS